MIPTRVNGLPVLAAAPTPGPWEDPREYVVLCRASETFIVWTAWRPKVEEYPYVNEDHVMVWACCLSDIGPVCEHRAGTRWEFRSPSGARKVEAVNGHYDIPTWERALAVFAERAGLLRMSE